MSLSDLSPRIAVFTLTCLLALGCPEPEGEDDLLDALPANSGALSGKCAPENSLAPASKQTGNVKTEKRWIHAYMNESYLWYADMPEVDPEAAPYVGSMKLLEGSKVPTSLDNYFEALKTPAKTSSGSRVDKFSFALGLEVFKGFTSGIEVGYGIEWARFGCTPGEGCRPPRRWVVARVEPGSPAAAANVARGDELTEVDGVDFINDVSDAGLDALNNALFPSEKDTSAHSLVFTTINGVRKETSLVAREIDIDPVPVVTTVDTPSGPVGYLVFTTHIAKAQAQLIDAFTQLQTANVKELVLDLRHNGGGLLGIASQVAYMIAGPTRTTGKVFEELVYNDKRDTENETTPFFDEACLAAKDGECTQTVSLPTLGLNRVAVITSRNTCSASEAIINSLRGIDVEVVTLGSTSCGKPYGFVPRENCGIVYAAMEFKGANAKGYGDYSDGFEAICPVTDTVRMPLGDPTEDLLAAALGRLRTGVCPSASSAQALSIDGKRSTDFYIFQSPVSTSRIVLPKTTSTR